MIGGVRFAATRGTPRRRSKPTHEERIAEFEARWQTGGFTFLGSFGDTARTAEANDYAAEFVREKIRARRRRSRTSPRG